MNSVIDFEANLSGLKDFQQKVILRPDRWRSFSTTTPLDWKSVRFTKLNRPDVPKQRGIYAFVVQFQDHKDSPLMLPPHGYVMYAGITGERARTRTLFDRYGDYLSDQRRPKRIPIWSMLNKWKEDIFFHFAAVGEDFDLAATELALNDAIIPPYVTKDFSAEVRKLVRTLRAS